ncbi:uncharacterized protein LOC128984385 [Macrosteles quadrilineatus]|uniref:uncharacterized protein LOC128984385 n=1 Tax=Macrosteles quadrilineatus TaxID=74068 RepID=UPI0023E248BC|nr:uncharacterized protein LOC128984385 [Macrosteles quadrilineatus]
MIAKAILESGGASAVAVGGRDVYSVATTSRRKFPAIPSFLALDAKLKLCRSKGKRDWKQEIVGDKPIEDCTDQEHIICDINQETYTSIIDQNQESKLSGSGNKNADELDRSQEDEQDVVGKLKSKIEQLEKNLKMVEEERDSLSQKLKDSETQKNVFKKPLENEDTVKTVNYSILTESERCLTQNLMSNLITEEEFVDDIQPLEEPFIEQDKEIPEQENTISKEGLRYLAGYIAFVFRHKYPELRENSEFSQKSQRVLKWISRLIDQLL